MSKSTIIFLIIASVLVVAGIAIFLIVMSINNWDFKNLSTVKLETNSYVIEDDFSNITITTKTANIKFLPSDDDKCTVVCYEEEKLTHNVKAESDTLIVNINDTRKWYDYINIFSASSPEITVYLPIEKLNSLNINGSTGEVDIPSDFTFENIDVTASTGNVKCYASAAGDIKIKVSTGKINIADISATNLSLSVTTGKITAADITCGGNVNVDVSTGKTDLKNIDCKNLSSDGDTGDIELTNVIASESFNIKRSTGDVEFEKCDANEIFVKTSTGDIDGSLLSDKIFITQTSTGDIEVPKTTTGGRCELTTSTGDIEIKIKK